MFTNTRMMKNDSDKNICKKEIIQGIPAMCRGFGRLGGSYAVFSGSLRDQFRVYPENRK